MFEFDSTHAVGGLDQNDFSFLHDRMGLGNIGYCTVSTVGNVTPDAALSR